jgi:hypothetical protein
MTLPPLYVQRQEIVSSLRGSTTSRAAEVADRLDGMLQAWEARARAGEAAAQRREQAIREKILKAAGALPALMPGHGNWCTAVARRIERNPVAYGFEAGLPDRQTIRKAWHHITRMTVLTPTAQSTSATYASFSST